MQPTNIQGLKTIQSEKEKKIFIIYGSNSPLMLERGKKKKTRKQILR